MFHSQNKKSYAKWSENCEAIINRVPFYNMHIIDKVLFEKLFVGESYDSVRNYSFIDIGASNSKNYVNKLMKFDFKNYMVGDILTKVDRASMMNSIEFRTPFLNQEVVRFANSIPQADKVDLKFRKKIVKEVAKKYLPPDYDFQRKAGFSIPIEGWLNNNNISEKISEYLTENSSVFTDVQLKKIFETQKTEGGLAEFIIGIWIFEKWRKRLGVK